jgi:hypothetical protein
MGLLGALAVCLSLQGENSGGPALSPYQAIVQRNLFHLSPPQAPSAPEPAKAPPPNIHLTGLTTLAGRCALLKTTSPAKAGETPAVKFYTILEGDRQDDIEVLAIDEKAGSARLRCAGAEIKVCLKDNDVSEKTPAAPVASPPSTHQARPELPQPGGIPALPAQIRPRPVRTGMLAPPENDPAANAGESGRHPGFDEHGL